MSKRRSKEHQKIDRLVRLEVNARTRYVYFIHREPEKTGYWWELVGPNDLLVCESNEYATKAECLKSLRAAQRHASTTQIRDDAA